MRLDEVHCKLGIPSGYGTKRRLPCFEEADELVDVGLDIFERPQRLTPSAATAWCRMRDRAAAEGVQLQLVSAFRGIEYQVQVIEKKLAAGRSIDEILRVNAAPGFSEHHTGNAVDITTPRCAVLEESFEETDAFAWLAVNASRYGFRMSYPRDNSSSFAYEPWHWIFEGDLPRSDLVSTND